MEEDQETVRGTVAPTTLTVRKRKARRKAIGTRAPILVEARPNARWSLDFVHDQFANGQRFRVLNVVDDVTRECLAAIPDTSISGHRVARELTALIERRGKPAMIVSDNGTELTSTAILRWGAEHRIEWHDIAPGKPMQNGNSCGRVIGPLDRCLFRPHLQRPDARRAAERDPVLRHRPCARGCRPMDPHLQHRATAFGLGLPAPG